jgi:hypothetical protein
MIANAARKSLSVVLSIVLVPASFQTLYGFQVPAADTGNSTDAAPMSVSDLQALVAPIALYPDALVAQVLSAATFPDQVAIAAGATGCSMVMPGYGSSPPTMASLIVLFPNPKAKRPLAPSRDTLVTVSRTRGNGHRWMATSGLAARPL